MSLAISKVRFNNDKIVVGLNDKNDIEVPLSLYPRLQNATYQQRNGYELWNNGKWLHWEEWMKICRWTVSCGIKKNNQNKIISNK